MANKPGPAATPADLGASAHSALMQWQRGIVHRAANALLKDVVKWLAVMVVGLAAALAFTVMTKEPPVMLYVTDDLRVVPATPLNDASMLTRERVSIWAQRALVAPWAFDYENYRQQINGSMNQYFTEQGGAAFIESMLNEGTIDTVRKNNYVSTMSLETTPIISGETQGDQAKAWRITARAKLTYKNSREVVTTTWDITAVIVRDNDKLSKDRVIAISQYVMTPARGGTR